MQDPDRIWHLIAKKLAGEANEDELKELEQLLQQNPGTSFPVEQLTHLWNRELPNDNATAEEAFNKHLDRWAKKKADLTYEKQKTEQATWKDRSKKPWLLYTFFNSNGLVNHYFRLIWRGLMQSKAVSFINIAGLAVGMASALLIILWIRNELSMDRFHTKADRTYLMLNRAKFDGEVDVWGSTPHPLGPTLKARFPQQVEEAVRMSWVAAFVLKNEDKVVQTEGLLTDSAFLQVFDFPLRKGDARSALTKPHSILLTEKLAKQLFDEGDAMGKTILIDSNVVFTVTGILKDLPNNTQFTFDYLVPWSYMKEIKWENLDWRFNSTITYVVLKQGITEQKGNELFKDLKKEHDKGQNTELLLHPLSTLWLWGKYDDNGKLAGGRIENVRLFSIIAAFILLIACINYMNLSTARSDKRSKEVGISKVVGAGKTSLVARFMGESILVSFFAGIVALLLAQLSLPLFNELTVVIPQKKLFIPYGDPWFWWCALGFIIFTGLLAGSYPAFYLSGYKPLRVLQRSYKKVHTLVAPRKILVVLQFSCAIIFIISTIIIYRQIIYGKERDPGYEKKDLAFVYVKGDMLKNYEAIKEELFSKKLITDITRTSSPVTDVWSSDDDYSWEGKDTTVRMGFAIFEAENHFIELHNFKMIAGRDFDIMKYPADTSAMILTESAVKRMKLKNPIGSVIKKHEHDDLHVIGIINDFIPEEPFYPVYPIVIHHGTEGFGVINFKLNPELSKKSSKEKITEVFKKHNPGYVVEYRLIEDEYASKFVEEEQRGKLAALFAGLTIFISCLGLFALAACMAESRIKEIGVRKVLGASVTNITTLLSKDFLKLVIISFVIASPLAGWAMHNWLQHYPYRVSITWWVFALTGFISIFIAAATVIYQSIKAAMTNPAKSLRAD
jgi:putative ABC transport system permease protein